MKLLLPLMSLLAALAAAQPLASSDTADVDARAPPALQPGIMMQATRSGKILVSGVLALSNEAWQAFGGPNNPQALTNLAMNAYTHCQTYLEDVFENGDNALAALQADWSGAVVSFPIGATMYESLGVIVDLTRDMQRGAFNPNEWGAFVNSMKNYWTVQNLPLNFNWVTDAQFGTFPAPTLPSSKRSPEYGSQAARAAPPQNQYCEKPIDVRQYLVAQTPRMSWRQTYQC